MHNLQSIQQVTNFQVRKQFLHFDKKANTQERNAQKTRVVTEREIKSVS